MKNKHNEFTTNAELQKIGHHDKQQNLKIFIQNNTTERHLDSSPT
jgi:hypothetical protein